MNLYDPMEIVVTQDTTYILISHINDSYRRIYTDGRDWPAEVEPSYAANSIGKWLDTTGSGHYGRARGGDAPFPGPRAFESTGCRCTVTTRASSKERSIWTGPTATSSMTTSRYSITLDAALTLHKKIARANAARRCGSDLCEEDNALVSHRQGRLFPQRRRLSDPTRKARRPPICAISSKSQK